MQIWVSMLRREMSVSRQPLGVRLQRWWLTSFCQGSCHSKDSLTYMQYVSIKPCRKNVWNPTFKSVWPTWFVHKLYLRARISWSQANRQPMACLIAFNWQSLTYYREYYFKLPTAASASRFAVHLHLLFMLLCHQLLMLSQFFFMGQCCVSPHVKMRRSQYITMLPVQMAITAFFWI